MIERVRAHASDPRARPLNSSPLRPLTRLTSLHLTPRQEDEGKRAELEALGDAVEEEGGDDDEIPPPNNAFRRIFYNIVTSKVHRD